MVRYCGPETGPGAYHAHIYDQLNPEILEPMRLELNNRQGLLM